MFTFSHYFNNISPSSRFFSQSVSIYVKPVERFSDGVLVLHLETMLSVIAHVFGQFNDTVLGLEDIANIRESQRT